MMFAVVDRRAISTFQGCHARLEGHAKKVTDRRHHVSRPGNQVFIINLVDRHPIGCQAVTFLLHPMQAKQSAMWNAPLPEPCIFRSCTKNTAADVGRVTPNYYELSLRKVLSYAGNQVVIVGRLASPDGCTLALRILSIY